MGDIAARGERPDATDVFSDHRPLLLAVAYRVLASMTETEDVVQDAWLRWSGARPEEVADPRAFLVRVTTRLAIDRLRRARTRRETYVGPWLPEPLLTDGDVAEGVELAESVSMALLVVLETLSPLERATFVLREVFAYPYAEIAAILDRSEPATRQLARRAREHVRARRPRFDPDPDARRRVTERFLAACAGGDLGALLDILAPDVTLIADGGGKALAPPQPIRGAEAVGRFLLATLAESRVARFLRSIAMDEPAALRIRLVELNGGPGLVATAGGVAVTALVLDVADDRARTLYLIANPDKLGGLNVPDVP